MLLATCLIAMAASPPPTAPINGPQTFNEDFDHLDLTRWTTHFPWGGRYVPGSKEEEYYVDPGSSLNPFSIKDGILSITADRATDHAKQLQGRHYSSGILTSYSSFAQLYGYFEMRAKMPPGRGLWPTFWLAPTDQTWPPEIDVVETVGDPTKMYATVHYGKPEHHIGFAVDVPDTTAEFHVYGMLWTAEYIAWYFDGRRIAFTPTPPDLHQKKMYLLVNLAVGGKWPGPPTAQTAFPAKLQIDYIRAYALPERQEKP